MGAELFHADRRIDRQTDIHTGTQAEWQADMTKLTVAFRNFANAPQ
jgi:hypothetical protein